MITGVTKSGFNYSIEEAALDDWEFLDELASVDKGNFSHITSIPKMLLGEAQAKELLEHLRNEEGRIPASSVVKELGDIFAEANALKNSKPLPA